MHKQLVKGIPWVLLSIILGFIFSFIFGINLLKSDSTFDINIYDTYFVLEGIWFFYFFTFFFLSLIYVFRNIHQKFKNYYSFWILTISGILLVFILSKAIAIIGRLFISDFNNPTKILTEIDQEILSIWSYLSNIFHSLQILVVSTLLFTSYKTGLNSRKTNSS